MALAREGGPPGHRGWLCPRQTKPWSGCQGSKTWASRLSCVGAPGDFYQRPRPKGCLPLTGRGRKRPCLSLPQRRGQHLKLGINPLPPQRPKSCLEGQKDCPVWVLMARTWCRTRGLRLFFHQPGSKRHEPPSSRASTLPLSGEGGRMGAMMKAQHLCGISDTVSPSTSSQTLVPAGSMEKQALRVVLCWINTSFPFPAISSDSHSSYCSKAR